MRDKFRNIFMLFGIAVIVIMIFTFDVDMPELLANLKRAGWQLPLIILLWVLIYFMNALSWFVIINDKQEVSISSQCRASPSTMPPPWGLWEASLTASWSCRPI